MFCISTAPIVVNIQNLFRRTTSRSFCCKSLITVRRSIYCPFILLLRRKEERFNVWWALIIHIHICAKVLSYFDGFPFVCFQNFLMFLRRPQGLVGSHAIKLFLHQSPIPPPGHLVRCPSPNKMKSFYLKVLWIFLSSPPIQHEIFEYSQFLLLGI